MRPTAERAPTPGRATERLAALNAALAATLATILLVGCSTPTTVVSTDLRYQTGVYVVGYSSRADVREMFEDQLVRDLTARGMTGFPSHADIPDITRSDAAEVMRHAAAHQAAAVVLVRERFLDADQVAAGPEAHVTVEHPDVEAFYAATRAAAGTDIDPDREAIAEVLAWLIDGTKSNLVWSGSTWTFDADGRGSAVADISTTVADGLVEARKALLGPRLPNSDIQ